MIRFVLAFVILIVAMLFPTDIYAQVPPGSTYQGQWSAFEPITLIAQTQSPMMPPNPMLELEQREIEKIMAFRLNKLNGEVDEVLDFNETLQFDVKGIPMQTLTHWNPVTQVATWEITGFQSRDRTVGWLHDWWVDFDDSPFFGPPL